MLSSQPSRDVAVEPARSGGERELKFTLADGRADLTRRWLQRVSRRDPEFPEAVVWTIYYDTPGLHSLGEKINSDFLKRKIRVRWYSDLEGQPAGPAFVEAKLRIGNQRSKVRSRLPYPAEEVAGWDLRDPRLVALPSRLDALGVLTGGPWRPVMLIRYRRDRFIEPLTTSRVSLDSDIALADVNPTFVSACDRSPIGIAVLEIKGAGDELPVVMRPILHFGARKQSFSKFLAVYSHMTRTVF